MNLFVAAFCIPFLGCAHIWADEQGRKHVVGLVAMVLPADGAGKSGSPEFVRISSIGLSVVRLDQGGGIAIGYQSYGSMVLDSNACAMPGTLMKQSNER